MDNVVRLFDNPPPPAAATLAFSWPTYPPPRVTIYAKAKGCLFWQAEGESELDFIARVKLMAKAGGLSVVTTYKRDILRHFCDKTANTL